MLCDNKDGISVIFLSGCLFGLGVLRRPFLLRDVLRSLVAFRSHARAPRLDDGVVHVGRDWGRPARRHPTRGGRGGVAGGVRHFSGLRHDAPEDLGVHSVRTDTIGDARCRVRVLCQGIPAPPVAAGKGRSRTSPSGVANLSLMKSLTILLLAALYFSVRILRCEEAL